MWLTIPPVSTHSRAKAAGSASNIKEQIDEAFQLTAARRRLDEFADKLAECIKVSTHSRAKAAGTHNWLTIGVKGFQLTAARRRLVMLHV